MTAIAAAKPWDFSQVLALVNSLQSHSDQSPLYERKNNGKEFEHINGNDSRSLFFVFQPTVGEQVDEVTIWLNGGPGCSSLEGFIQENGRFLWQYGLPSPLDNPYSWVNLTNMLWYVTMLNTQ